MSTPILLVEDEPGIADTLLYALQSEGFVTRWCTTGAEALLVQKADPARLVILDVGLPDMNGFDLCRALRAVSDVPILFLTARSSEVDRIVGLEIGADDYVTKPFSPREISARVRAILRRAPHASLAEVPRPPRVTSPVPVLRVDSERCRIEYRGEALDLTRYEYRMLALLAGRPGRVFSRDDLMQQVWEDPGASMDRTVDAHIKTLRAKLRGLGGDAAADLLQTHRGLGYSLRSP